MADNSPHPCSSAAPDLGELADLWTEMNAKRAAIDNKIAREARALEAERAEAKDLSREADDLKARHAEVAEVTHRVREGNRLDEERIVWLEGHMENAARLMAASKVKMAAAKLGSKGARDTVRPCLCGSSVEEVIKNQCGRFTLFCLLRN